VRPVLEELWRASAKANRELVACLGGHREGETFKITRAAPLNLLIADRASTEAGSDSVSVGPRLTRLSIEACRPPRWVGTVHTHGAGQASLRYPKFSSFDRTVISEWHRRWRHESVFCVLFSEETVPYCEYQPGARPSG
jgi:hypothetical protein